MASEECLPELSDASERAQNKIEFLRGYLTDVSYDGAEFMQAHSRFLSLQYPRRCDKAWGFWFEQVPADDCEPGVFPIFQGFDVGLFVSSVDDLDIESVRAVLPFDRIFVRKPAAAGWTQSEIAELVHKVRADLESSGERARIRSDVAGAGLMCLEVSVQ